MSTATRSDQRQQPLSVNPALIKKYTMRGPRYTSYPTAPEWTEQVGPGTYLEHVRRNNERANPNPLSLYLHVPFCPKRCYYCACNVIITPKVDVLDHYVDLLSREIDLVASQVRPDREVIQLHLGGGTPTYLSPVQLDRLLESVSTAFRFGENAERSIEVDARITTPEHLDVLKEHQFDRISYGVEDFSPLVQEAIGRIQPFEQTEGFTRQCRAFGFESVNIDLVYGLPLQTRELFNSTIDAILELDPDRVALYNYAHLPSKVPNQRRVDASTLPDSDERVAVLCTAIERFTSNGYEYVGMDHFAKPHDELTLAQKEGTLQRNFMGFTTRAGTDLYAFGTSAISSLPCLYTQNTKNLRKYEDSLHENRPPVERGIVLTQDDRIRRWVIMELMCNCRVEFSRFDEIWNENFQSYFREEIEELSPFIEDGLVDSDLAHRIELTSLGQIMVRPITMVFDRYLQERKRKSQNTPLFSKTL